MALKVLALLALVFTVSAANLKFAPTNFLQQDPAALSKEIIAYIMGDVSKGAATPDDAYFNIMDMVEDGTIFEDDGLPAMSELELIMRARGIPFFIQDFAPRIN